MSNVQPMKRGGIDRSKVSRGRVTEKAIRVLLYGPEKVGKTTFANGAPDAFIIDIESGSLDMDAHRVQVHSWEETMQWLAAVERGEEPCKTVVIDSVSRLEEHLEKKLFPNEGVSEYKGGYGKGEDAMAVQWREYLLLTDRIWQKGINVIHIGHAKVKGFNDPEGNGYDRWIPSLREKMAGPLKRYSDYVLFAKRETTTIEAKDGKRKGAGNGTRLLHTVWGPAYDAGGRVDLPDPMSLKWSEFYGTVVATESRVDALLKEIDAALLQLDDEMAAKVRPYVDENKKDANKLAEVANHLAQQLGVKQENKS